MSFNGHRKVTKPDGSSEKSWESYVCGHCNTKATGAVVALYESKTPASDTIYNKWILCINCSKGSVKIGNSIYPRSSFGPKLQGLPEDVSCAYEEARRCIASDAYTAAELICRQILMHVAVEKGAKDGDSFSDSLLYLESEGYITPSMKEWSDLIRRLGSKATNNLKATELEIAESIVMFTAELLRLIYEMEFRAGLYTGYSDG